MQQSPGENYEESLEQESKVQLAYYLNRMGHILNNAEVQADQMAQQTVIGNTIENLLIQNPGITLADIETILRAECIPVHLIARPVQPGHVGVVPDSKKRFPFVMLIGYGPIEVALIQKKKLNVSSEANLLNLQNCGTLEGRLTA